MREASLTLSSEPIKQVAAIARDMRVAVVLGGVKLRDNGRLFNSALVFDADGELVARYDKMHLFNATVAGTHYAASAEEASGDRLVLLEMNGVKLGVTICFDLRFPELFAHLCDAGAEILLIPSSFTRVTGRAHWSTLVRARAIDNGAFVVASATIGDDYSDSDPRATFGHSIAVDPWGNILADLGAQRLASATLQLDMAERERVRSILPIHTVRHANPINPKRVETSLLKSGDSKQ
jgi:predicted amidohydrolase